MAEYTAMSMAMRDVLPLKHLVKAVSKGVGMEPTDLATIKTTVWEDNNGALTLAKMEPGRTTPRSKHFAVRYHWFRSHLKPNSIEIERIDSKRQRGDLFTKALRPTDFENIRKQLMGW
jgi:hypothetical protein